VAYAAQAVRLARKASCVDLAPETIEDLRLVLSPHSNLNAAQVFESYLDKP
jgi:hypothetical protein